jgi:hypothetical protein
MSIRSIDENTENHFESDLGVVKKNVKGIISNGISVLK